MRCHLDGGLCHLFAPIGAGLAVIGRWIWASWVRPSLVQFSQWARANRAELWL